MPSIINYWEPTSSYMTYHKICCKMKHSVVEQGKRSPSVAAFSWILFEIFEYSLRRPPLKVVSPLHWLARFSRFQVVRVAAKVIQLRFHELGRQTRRAGILVVFQRRAQIRDVCISLDGLKYHLRQGRERFAEFISDLFTAEQIVVVVVPTVDLLK